MGNEGNCKKGTDWTTPAVLNDVESLARDHALYVSSALALSSYCGDETFIKKSVDPEGEESSTDVSTGRTVVATSIYLSSKLRASFRMIGIGWYAVFYSEKGCDRIGVTVPWPPSWLSGVKDRLIA